MPNAVRKEENPQLTQDTKRKKVKWPFFVGGAVVLCLIFALGGLKAGGGEAHQLAEIDLAELVQQDLQDTVSATGTVESAESTMVYSTVGYPVQEVLVEVGDRVEEGQLLARLDDQKIRDQIESQEASLHAAQSSSSAAIRSARDTYENFREGLDSGMNTSIINAQNLVNNSYNAYVTAQNVYDRYVSGLQKGENTGLIQQENALRAAENASDAADLALEDALDALDEADEALLSAERALENAEAEADAAGRAFREAQQGLLAAEEEADRLSRRQTELEGQLALTPDAALQAELDQIRLRLSGIEEKRNSLQLQKDQAQQKLTQSEVLTGKLEAALEQAQLAYDVAEKQADRCEQTAEQTEDSLDAANRQYHAALTGADNTLADYARNVETARDAYESAQTQLEAAKTAAQNQLEAYENSLNSARAGANKENMNVSLRQLQVNLESAEITAPAAGTVTAVYAEVGSPGSGLLFIIEDTENFVVTTSVKDYDVVHVGVGTEAVIRSNATGDEDYRGTVTSVAPTANKNPAGMTDTTGDIAFATEVAVDSKDTPLRIGMNVRLNFIIAEEKNTLAAPYDAVYTADSGETCILTADRDEKGAYTLREIPVRTGLETDLEIAVSGDGLTAGMTVICNPEQYLPWLGETLTVKASARDLWGQQ